MSTKADERCLRIGKVAERLGVTTRTIRYHEELGLLGGGQRSKGAHRLYRESDITHLQEVLRLRDLLGLSLEAIVDLAQAEEAQAALRDEWEHDPSYEDRMRIIEAATPLIEQQLELVRARQKTLAKFAGDLRDRLKLIAEFKASSRSRAKSRALPTARSSRLVAELLASLDGGSPEPRILRGRCLAYGDGISFWPLAEMLKAHAHAFDTDPSDMARARISAAAEAVFASAGADAPQVLAATLTASIGLASADRVQRSAQVFVVCTARPELTTRRPTWGGGRMSFTGLAVEPLDTAESAQLARCCSTGTPMPPNVPRSSHAPRAIRSSS